MSWYIGEAVIDEEATAKVVEAMIKSFARDLPEYLLPAESAARTGLHASDLTFTRKTAFKHHLPQPMTEKEMMLFSWGRGWELEVGRRLALEHAHSSTLTLRTGRLVTFTPDFTHWGPYVDLPAAPIELKGRRANLAAPGEESDTYQTYLKQLNFYMAASRSTLGWLLVMAPRHGAAGGDYKAATQPKMHVVRCTLEEHRFAEILEAVAYDAELLDAARKDVGEIERLEYCPDFLCGKSYIKEHAKCLTCKIELKQERQIKAATHSQHRKTDRVWAWRADCPWLRFCNPPVARGVEIE